MKFGLAADWQQVKYDVSIDMPDLLDLSSLKGFGLQPGEEVMPDASAAGPAGGCVPALGWGGGVAVGRSVS